MTELRAPMPFFGGKREIASVVWERLGSPLQYIEPFCGSAAVLLAAPKAANLEVVNDLNGFIANFWRAVKHQPGEVAREADYPVSHIDLGARHVWLMHQRDRVGSELQDPNWIGDAKVAGWWLWGQCSWIGSGWCEWLGKIPHAGDAGRGVQALGQIPHAGNAGRGVMLTSSGATAWEWMHRIAARLERVRVTHGSWERCLNNHYGDLSTAVFFDPPYLAYEKLYGSEPVARPVETWAREHAELRVALCGHVDDYSLDGWTCVRWKRPRLTYNGSSTTDREAIWFSPACLKPINERKGETLEMFVTQAAE
jgi:DNA adenine methylase